MGNICEQNASNRNWAELEPTGLSIESEFLTASVTALGVTMQSNRDSRALPRKGKMVEPLWKQLDRFM